MTFTKKLLFSAILALLLASSPAMASAQEKITSFDSRIIVNQDGSMLVTESIAVRSEQVEIIHGIYRDFPTRYKDRAGNNYNVGFDLVSVKRDGQPTAYDTVPQPNGIRIYIRDRDIDLPAGDYVFELTYQTTRQLGFFTEHDELYWNVTGNGWSFPIERASANVTLPDGINSDQIRLEAFTGPQGATDKLFTANSFDSGAVFATTQSLPPENGLTIVVGWPKGFVHEPTAEEKQALFIKDNLRSSLIMLALVPILLYYVLVWLAIGKDPRKGSIIAQYEPPQGLSPAAMGYLQRLGYKNELLVAEIINLAVQGRVKIDKSGAYYKIIKLISDAAIEALPANEKLMIENLFDGKDQIEIKQSQHTVIAETVQELNHYLKTNYGKYFSYHLLWGLIGVLISLVAFAIGLVFANWVALPIVAFMGTWLSLWTFGTTAMVMTAIKGWFAIIKGDRQAAIIGTTIMMTVFSAPFLVAEIIVLFILSQMVGMFIMAAMFITIATNIIFLYLLKAPTVSGRKLMDEIDGFKLFLSVTEKDRMNFHNPPQQTPELFEKFLPYALALGVENKWSQQFAGVFARLHEQGHDYNPGWYSGAALAGFSAGTFASSLSSSMSSSISSSSSAPGSSSGFSGGGGSGGGGGGGGGGGC